MVVYGLTGKTGAGKSTACKFLKEKGFYAVDCDLIARKVTEKGSDVLLHLSEAFGEDILFPDGTLNRSLLAQRAFQSKEKTQLLNKITHTAIDEVIRKELKEAESRGFSKAIIDGAALLESPSKRLCEKMIVVTAPFELRLERILSRDNISSSQALSRLNAQKEDEYYLSQADIIIRNYPPFDLKNELEKVL